MLMIIAYKCGGKGMISLTIPHPWKMICGKTTHWFTNFKIFERVRQQVLIRAIMKTKSQSKGISLKNSIRLLSVGYIQMNEDFPWCGQLNSLHARSLPPHTVIYSWHCSRKGTWEPFSTRGAILWGFSTVNNPPSLTSLRRRKKWGNALIPRIHSNWKSIHL